MTEFNYGNYIKIKKDLLDSMYLSDKKRYGEENATSPEDLFAQNAEWLIPSAVAFNVLYKKNYKSYLDVINRYNEMLPKLKEKMPKVEEEASIKTNELQKQLDEIIEEKNKHDTRKLGLTPSDSNYDEERRKFDEMTRQERGINGRLTSIKNYIDYSQL